MSVVLHVSATGVAELSNDWVYINAHDSLVRA